MKSLFKVGQVVATPAALAVLATHGRTPLGILLRHTSGDFGKYGKYDEIQLTKEEDRHGALATDDDGKLNVWGIRHEGRIMSSYQFGDDRIWVITEWDRSYTTILLPEEY